MEYYRVLGLAHTASMKEVKHAYRRLAMIYHPDVNGNDQTKTNQFKKIKHAYEAIEKGMVSEGWLGSSVGPSPNGEGVFSTLLRLRLWAVEIHRHQPEHKIILP